MSEPDNEVDREVDWQVACERAAILQRTFAGPDGPCDLRLSEAADAEQAAEIVLILAFKQD